MPVKVNPTQCESMMMLCIQIIANNVAVTIGNTQGNFQLNTFMPMIIYDVNQSINLLADGMNSLNKNCVADITINEKKMKKNSDESLMLVTALKEVIGYHNAAMIANNAFKKRITLKESALELKLISEKEYDKIMGPKKMILFVRKIWITQKNQ